LSTGAVYALVGGASHVRVKKLNWQVSRIIGRLVDANVFINFSFFNFSQKLKRKPSYKKRYTTALLKRR
jgi:hypothetical protein